ncbi:App1 family protein [Segeticoccus rhizosphaerae]|jgi:phosphatidate phosphatase APP1|uniref:App1 family protein n=1 Tax=Segeticoccus rhizosphaerae TaxID=1104777 RepID=UPI0010C0A748|nr:MULTISPECIES: phosphatase domain-containing protein [Intrasporangiaceae]
MARPHAAALIEDVLHRPVDLVLRRFGWEPRIVPGTGYGATGFVRVLARVILSRQTDAPRPEVAQTRRGWRNFLTSPAVGVPVMVRAGEAVARTVTDRSGYVDVVLADHGLAPGWHDVSIEVEQRPAVAAPVCVIGPDVTFGLVSDIDDTVMVTALPRPLIAAWNSFVLHEQARHVVPGMAQLYRELLDEHPGAPIFYLSTGAWNTAPTLSRFLQRHGYPLGPLLLTDWGPTNTGWFRSGQEHKRESLRRLARELPQIRWVLVGDDGQHDPRIYGDFARAHPDLVQAIAIRQLTPGEQVLSHGLPVANEDFAHHGPRPVPIYRAGDGFGLGRALAAARRAG